MQDPKQLTKSRIQLHYAIQFMAATGMALGLPKPDGSQMTLDWDADLQGFIGQHILDVHHYLALDPINLTSLILNGQHEVVAALPLIDKTMETVLNWHKVELTKLGIDAERICFLSYPDDFPDHPLAHNAVFDKGNRQERQTLVAYFAETRPLLQSIFETRAGASPIYTWPHHFDMATLITLSGQGESAHTIGVGFSPGDGGFGQPYWYVTPWPYPSQTALPSLSVGSWHTEGWIGAILRADEVDNPTSKTTLKTLTAFLEESVNACYEIL